MELRFGKPEEVGMSSDRIAKLEELQKYWVEKGVAPIMITLIARKGVIVSYKCFVDPDYNREYGPYDINTIFQLASISKAFTATSAMILNEEGKISMQWAVEDYIPEYKGENKEKVQLHNLLTHTTGLDDEKLWEIINNPDFKIDMSKCPQGMDPFYYKYLNGIYAAPLKALPGAEMSYSGTGFELMSEIIRRETGMNIQEFANDRIFEPLGMKDTFYTVPDDMIKRVAKHPSNAPFPNFTNYEKLKSIWASGSLCSTAMDMAKFCQMLLNGGFYGKQRIMSKASINKMTSNNIPGVAARYGEELFDEASWGLGWNVSGNKHDYTGTLRSERTYSHSGCGNTLMLVDPENELIAINLQITMKRINGRAFMYFQHFTDCAIASIEE